MISSLFVYGSTVALATTYGTAYYIKNKKETAPWADKLSRGVYEDSRALWNALTFQGRNGIINNNSNNKNTLFNKNFTDLERDRLFKINEFDQLNKKYESLKKSLKDMTSEKDSEMRKSIEAEINKLNDELKSKKLKLNEISAKVNSDMYMEKPSHLVKSLESKDDTSEKIDKIAARGLEGWGENAQEFAAEEINERKLFGDKSKPSIPQQELNDLKKFKQNGWFKYNTDKYRDDEMFVARNSMKGLEGWGENAAQFAQDEYDELKKNIGKKK